MAATNGKKFGFIIGRNLPGYLPDGAPDFYPDAESAQFGFADMVTEAIEDSDLDFIESVTLRDRVTHLTEEDLDDMGLGEEINLMIDNHVYWITKSLTTDDIILSCERIDV